MKKFMLLHYGFETPTPEIMDAWMKWFSAIEKHIADPGKHFPGGVEITHDGKVDLPMGKDSITGYTVINAESMEEAVKIAETCPIILGIRVYEMKEG